MNHRQARAMLLRDRADGLTENYYLAHYATPSCRSCGYPVTAHDGAQCPLSPTKLLVRCYLTNTHVDLIQWTTGPVNDVGTVSYTSEELRECLSELVLLRSVQQLRSGAAHRAFMEAKRASAKSRRR